MKKDQASKCDIIEGSAAKVITKANKKCEEEGWRILSVGPLPNQPSPTETGTPEPDPEPVKPDPKAKAKPEPAPAAKEETKEPKEETEEPASTADYYAILGYFPV